MKSLNLSKQHLENLYLKEKLSMREISFKLKCGETVIHKWLHKFKIPIRPRSESLKGYIKSIEHRKKISEHHKIAFKGSGNPNWKRGEKIKGILNPNWKGGISGWQKLFRGSADYKRWRESVFKRDNYTCQSCSRRGGYLQADHIKPFAFFKTLIFDINNGRTLCLTCHRKTFFGTKIQHYYTKNGANSVED